MSLSDVVHPDKEALSGPTNGSVPPEHKRPAPEDGVSDLLPRPLSPDGPEILSELQRFIKPQAHGLPTATPGAAQENGGAPVKPVPVKESSLSDDDISSMPLDLRGTKRKSSPADEEKDSDPQPAAKRSATLPHPPRFPFGAYGLNPSLLGSMCHPLFMGTGSPYFQPHAPLADPRLMFPMTPDQFSLPRSSSSSSSSSSSASPLSTTNTQTTPSSSSASTNAASVSQYLLRPGMTGMLPPGFPLPYGQALGMYPSSLLPAGLPAATPGPAGTSFLSRFPSSSLLGPALNTPSLSADNESSSSGTSGSHMDDNDDIIEVTGQ